VHRIVPRALLLLLLAVVAPPARAAESYDGCTNFITTVPVTIATPGTWCMTGNVATNAAGEIVTIAASDVTLDCNGFKLDGTSRTQTTFAIGIRAGDVSNITVRHCHVRGFSSAILLAPPQDLGLTGGHLVEDNLVERCTEQAMLVVGDDSVVRRNRVLETNNVAQTGAFGITAYGLVDVLDNVVSGVRSNNSIAAGLFFGHGTGSGPGGSVRGNLVRGVSRTGASGTIYGLFVVSEERKEIRDNTFIGAALPGSIGIACDSTTNIARNNTILGFATGRAGCHDDGNIIRP
jgi:hypothetical protein